MLNICLSISSRDKHLTDRCSATTVYIQVASCRFKPVLFRLVAVVIALSARDRSLNQFHSTTQVSYCCRYMCHSHTQCKRGSAAGLSGTLSFLFLLAWVPVILQRGREGERERGRGRETEMPSNERSLAGFPLFLPFPLPLPCPLAAPFSVPSPNILLPPNAAALACKPSAKEARAALLAGTLEIAEILLPISFLLAPGLHHGFWACRIEG